jgi:hypothetical protein
MSYPEFQLAKAIAALAQSSAPNALIRVQNWASVIAGMASGKLRIGERQAVNNAPIWATTKVMHGGFATGELLAAGALTVDEERLLATLAENDIAANGASARAQLNAYFLSAPGWAQLQQLLQNRNYLLELPEHGALLAIAYLFQQAEVSPPQGDTEKPISPQGDTEKPISPQGDTENQLIAQRTLNEILPWSDRLRFYPTSKVQVVQSPAPRFDLASLQFDLGTARQLQAKLAQYLTPPAIQAQQNSLRHKHLYDQLVALWLETIAGEPPKVIARPSATQSSYRIEGGWPLSKMPLGWTGKAQEMGKSVSKLDLGKRSQLGELAQFLRRAIAQNGELSLRELGRVRLLLARYLSAYGAPSSQGRLALRARQQQQYQRTIEGAAMAAVIANRLEGYPLDQGVEDLTSGPDSSCLSVSPRQDLPPLLSAISAAEACIGAPAAAQPLRALRNLVSVHRRGRLPELLEARTLRSAEQVAKLLPQANAALYAQASTQAEVGYLLAQSYLAFAKRRSVLLLNYQRQVQFQELPWIAPLISKPTLQVQAKALCCEVLTLWLRHFPSTQMPNPLTRELARMSQNDEQPLPWVEELACDIFMGGFSAKFVSAAKIAASILQDSTYARYYAIDYALIATFDAKTSGDPATHPFATFCKQRASVSGGNQRASVAGNGMVIEQAQILTTHNMALAFAVFALDRSNLAVAAEQCMGTCLQLLANARRVLHIKNAAYAWRQWLLLLSFASRPDALVASAQAQLEQQTDQFKQQFAPYFAAALAAHHGQSLSVSPFGTAELPRLLGWSNGPHPWSMRKISWKNS